MKYVLLLILSISALFCNQVDYNLSSYEDNNFSIGEINNKDFKLIQNNYLNKGFSFYPVWIKLKVQNNTSTYQKMFFSFDNPTIDFIDFYENKKLKQLTGDNRSLESRKVLDIAFAFPLKLKPYEEKTYYFKVKTSNTFSVRFMLENEREYLKRTEQKKVFLVFFSGFVLSIMFYNLFLYLILKENTYLFYVFFEWSVLNILWSFSGFGYYFIWTDNIWFNEFSIRTFDDFSIIMGIIFTKNFLNTKYYFPKIDKLIYLLLGLLFYVMVTPWEWHSLLVKPVMIGSLISILLIAIFAVYKKIPTAKLYLFGWFCLIMTSMMTLLKNFSFLEINFFTTWGIYIGSMLEALIFSIALAKKIEILKEEKEHAFKISKEKLNYEVNKKTISLNEALKEKELLLKEIHHRVKNNLQIISSFITVASIKNDFSKTTFLSIQDRIRAISLLHEHLYRYKVFNEINITNYISELVNNIKNIYMNEQKISFDYEVSEVKITFDKTVIIGLILNELITNSLKYAFNGIKKPKIRIVLYSIGKNNILIIEDNGLGLKEGIDIEKVNSLGLKMVYRLATKQLKGKLETDFNNKTYFKITF